MSCSRLPLLLAAASLAALLPPDRATAQGPLESGPLESGLPVGALADQFLVKDCTGPAAGKTLCYYCRYADRPVVALFVRELDEDVAQLVAQVDAAVARHQQQRLAAFVILIGDDTRDTESRLKRQAKQLRLRHTPLTIYRDQPAKLRELYRLNPQASVTALSWKRGEVTVNRAFATTDIAAPDRESFLAAVLETLPR